jgi:hypothetical protein
MFDQFLALVAFLVVRVFSGIGLFNVGIVAFWVLLFSILGRRSENSKRGL